MSSVPMSYDNLQKILQHMEPNKRFLISRRIPSIQNAEKAAPLKLDRLSFGENGFAINNTEYQLRVIRDYGTNAVPAFFKKHKDGGISEVDVDKYGFEDWSRLTTVVPGDIVMYTEDCDEPPKRDISLIHEKEAEIEALRDEHADLTGEYTRKLRAEGFTYLEELKEDIEYPDDKDPEEYNYLVRLRRRLEEIVRRTRGIEDDISKKVHEIQPIDGDTRKSNTQHTETIEYTLKLHEAVRALLKFVFENRKFPVSVNTCVIGQYCIIKAPTDLKLKVENLKVDGALGAVCNALGPLIHESSFPLKQVLVESTYLFINDFQPEWARNAEKLIIGDHSSCDNVQWLPVFLSLQSKFVLKKYNDHHISLSDYVELVRSWIEKSKEVGTKFIFESEEKLKVGSVLDKVFELHPEAVRSHQCVTVPMKNASRIQVSFKENEDRRIHFNRKWILELAVLPSDE